MRHPVLMDKLQKQKAFTLIELLVVLAILALLIALVVPSLRMGLESGKRTQATAQIMELEAGLTAYKAEYGAWPPVLNSLVNADGDIAIPAADGSGWGEVYRVLSGYTNDPAGYVVNGTVNNRRQIHFIDLPSQALSAQNLPPFQTGTIDPALVQTIVDPWAHPYQLILDANGDGQVKAPDIQKKDGSVVEIPRNIAVWSQGADSANPSQFPCTWK